MTGFYVIRVFTESCFLTDYDYIFSMNVVIIVNFKRIHVIRKEVLSVDFEKVFVLHGLTWNQKSIFLKRKLEKWHKN